jgi:hypothetical protein
MFAMQHRIATSKTSGLEDDWGSVDVSCCCEKLVAEARDVSKTQRKERPPLEAATKQRLVKTEEISA